MNWGALGSIAEAAAAIAVLATLIYIAIQTRRSAAAAVSEGWLTTQGTYSNWRTAFFSDRSLSKILAKANRGEELDEEERIQFHFFCDEIFCGAVVAFASTELTGDKDQSEPDIEYLVQLLGALPGTIPEWQRLRPVMISASPKLVESVESRIPHIRGDA